MPALMTEPLHLVAKNGERLFADTAPTPRGTRDEGTHSVSLSAHLTHIMLLYPPSKPHTYKQPHPCPEPSPKRRAAVADEQARLRASALHHPLEPRLLLKGRPSQNGLVRAAHGACKKTPRRVRACYRLAASRVRIPAARQHRRPRGTTASCGREGAVPHLTLLRRFFPICTAPLRNTKRG